MTFVEFLGFLITLAAMIFIMIRRFLEEIRRRRNPELYEKEQEAQEKTLEEFLKSLDVDMAEEDKIPPPPPVRVTPPPPPPKKATQRLVKDEFTFTDRLEHYRPESAVEKRKMGTPIADRYKEYRGDRIVSPDLRREKDAYAIQEVPLSRAQKLLSRLPNKQEMVVLYEILHKPKGLS